MSGHIEEALKMMESGAEKAENGNGSMLGNLYQSRLHHADSVSRDKRTVALQIAEAFNLLSDAPSAFAGCTNCRAAYYQHGPNSLSTRFKPCDHFTDSDEQHANAVRESDEWVLCKIESLL